MNKLAKLLNRSNESLRALYGPEAKQLSAEDIEKVYSRNILSVEVDAKTRKGSSKGYLTGILYLASGNLSGVNVCPNATPGCLKACLLTAGKGNMHSVMVARLAKTVALFADRERFIATLERSIEKTVAKAKRRGMIPSIRLNGTSDLRWHIISELMHRFSDIQFYDYTKNVNTALEFINNVVPVNYHVTFSRAETKASRLDARAVLHHGGSVAVVYNGDIPTIFENSPTIDGDTTDLRFLDGKGKAVMLRAKGKAKKDKSGFVVDFNNELRKVA